MIESYARLIIAKRRKIKDVPESLRDDVRAYLAEQGYDEDGERL